MSSLTAATTAAKRFWRARMKASQLRCQSRSLRAQSVSGKQDFRYVAEEDVYICPAWQTAPLLIHHPKNMGWFCTAI